MSDLFYKNGLKFECTRCSKCCRHDPGYVFLSTDDLQSLVTATSMEQKQFIKTYCRVVDINGFRRLSLKERDNFDCIFWRRDGCEVYEHRPLQCRSYPFWSHCLDSPETWDAMVDECPGVNKGRVHSYADIRYWLDARAEAEFIVVSEL